MSLVTDFLLVAVVLLALTVLVLVRHIVWTRRTFQPSDEAHVNALSHPMTHPLDNGRYPHWWD